MGTYEARHAVADVETSPQRRLIMRSSLATAAVATVGAAGLATPASFVRMAVPAAKLQKNCWVAH